MLYEPCVNTCGKEKNSMDTNVIGSHNFVGKDTQGTIYLMLDTWK